MNSNQFPFSQKPVVLSATQNLKKFEDDCACDTVQFINSCLPKNTSNTVLKSPHSLYYAPLNESYEIVCNLLSQGNIALINAPSKQILEFFREETSLSRFYDQILYGDYSEVSEVIGKMIGFDLLEAPNNIKQTSQSIEISAWIHLTDRCNLRCSYCYLPHVREDMSLETGRASIEATFRSAIANGFQQVKLKYAGGEPLLRFSLIAELHSYAQSLAVKHGLLLEGVVLSNGTLLTETMIETLKSLELRLMISMDGLGNYHDSHRPYAGGRGSFIDVADAIELALSCGLTPNISITVSSRTIEGLPDIVKWILDHNLPFNLNFYRENELSNSYTDMRLDEEKIIEGMLAAFKVIENNLPRRPFLGGIIDRANLSVSHTHTCGVGQNYLVFDQNGQVAKCQMHIRKPVTDVHTADPLALIRADQIGIQNLPVMEKEGCKTCEWKHWCAGGCPLATHRATGRYDVKSPNCNIYKALFPEALRLEGLRLLKYQDDPEVVIAL